MPDKPEKPVEKKYRITRLERYAGGAGLTGRTEESVIAVSEDSPANHLPAGAEQLADDAETFDWRVVDTGTQEPAAAPATVKES